MALPVAFHDMPADHYPFTLRLLDSESREVRWEALVTGPCAIKVPGRAEVNDGRPLTAQITWANGSVTEAGP